jgi:phage host-nuclease inhibitor protein Gam
MTSHRKPRTIAAATTLLERFADLQGDIELIEAERNEAIAEANAEADKVAAPLLAERDRIYELLAGWWPGVAEQLTDGKRKSIELGGCLIGSRQGRDSLAIAGEESVIVTALQREDWAEQLLKVKVTLDKVAILKSIDGVYAKPLAKLGLSRKQGEETVFVERAEQKGVRT